MDTPSGPFLSFLRVGLDPTRGRELLFRGATVAIATTNHEWRDTHTRANTAAAAAVAVVVEVEEETNHEKEVDVADVATRTRRERVDVGHEGVPGTETSTKDERSREEGQGTRCGNRRMAEEVDRNVLRKYELHQKLGKGVRRTTWTR